MVLGERRRVFLTNSLLDSPFAEKPLRRPCPGQVPVPHRSHPAQRVLGHVSRETHRRQPAPVRPNRQCARPEQANEEIDAPPVGEGR